MRLISSTSDDKTVRTWDIASQTQLSLFPDNIDKVLTTKFHPEGTLLASGSLDGKIKIWDLRSNTLIQHYDAHDDGINEIAIHPNGKYLSSVSDDKSVKIWDLREGRLAYTLYSHEDACKSVAFSSDGQYFASAGNDKLIFVWQSNFQNLGEGAVAGDVRGSTLVKSYRNSEVEPMNRGFNQSEQLKEIEEAKYEEEIVLSPREIKENRLKELLSGHLEKIVFQLGEITENIQRLDQKLTKNEEMVQVLLNDDRVKPFIENNEDFIQGHHENIKVWDSMKANIEEHKHVVNKNIQNIFSVGALATTGMLKESIGHTH